LGLQEALVEEEHGEVDEEGFNNEIWDLPTKF